MASPNLNLFIARIMRIDVLRMGGASAGIIGSAGGDTDTVNNVKKTAIVFASEYSKSSPDQDELTRLSQEIIGFLQILQLTYTVSEDEVNGLMDELQMLMDNPTT